MMKLQNLLLVLIILFAQEVKSQSPGCATPPPDATTRQYIIDEIVKYENDYALAESTTTCLPVKIHIVRLNSGFGGFSPNSLSKAFANLNNAFRDTGIEFYVCGGVNYIDDTDFYNFNTSAPDNDVETDFTAGEIVTNAINFFIVGDIFLDGFGGAAGYAAYPSNNVNSHKIFMDAAYMVTTPQGTLAHELGHYFGLFHTHQGTANGPNNSSAERVVRTGVNANCDTNGDLLCDTDADPNDGQYNSACNYTGSATDDLGVIYTAETAITNIMSYYADYCVEGFSAGQLTRMNSGLITRQGHSAYDYSCTPDIVNAPTLAEIEFNFGVPKIKFVDNADNELGYIVERSSISSTTGFVGIGGTGANAFTYQDNGATPNTQYWYRLRAVNSACEGYSNVLFNGVDGGQCEENLNGYEYLGEWNDTKYFISDDSYTWEKAKLQANAVGGELVSINSAAENNQLSNWVSEIVFIGLNDATTEGTPEWDNGDPVTYDNIDDLNTESDDFVRRIAWNGKWQWVDKYAIQFHVIEIPCAQGCICPPTNEPVCGSDGVTYPNGCEAECAGIFNYTNGECSTGGGCPNSIAGFTTLGELGDSKYYLSNDIARPVDAQSEAESHGGYLVTINNVSENNFIQQNISEMVYIGLNDYDSEGNLKWFNGEPVSYNNVDPCGFCNENSANQDFVIMAPWNGTWSFSNFYNSRKYVMEIPCSGGPGHGNDLPDLTISNLDNVAGNMTQGDVEFFEFDLNNIGNAIAANSYKIEMFISSDQNLSNNDISVGEIQTANTFIGTDANIPGAITVPSVSNGNYYLIVKVDSDNNIEESNENNNTITSGQITIGSGGSGGCSGPTSISGFSFIGEFENSRYYFSNTVARPTDAQSTCESNGGYLASITSQAENDFILQGISGLTYIGLNDETTEGDLQWYSGESVGYDNLNICNFCNENSSNMDYAVMAGWNGEWSWSNFWNQRNYVMEIPCSSSTTNTLISIPENINNELDFIELVPNPANEFIGVQLRSTLEMEVDIRIFNARGEMVKKQQSILFKGLSGVEINISNLAAGMYWINIPQAKRNHSVKRFVKVVD